MPFSSIFKSKVSDLGTSSSSQSIFSRSRSKKAESKATYNASESPVVTPPPYSAVGSQQPAAVPASGLNSRASNLDAPKKDDPFDFLRSFDTVFLIDDSYSMCGRSWSEVAAALKAITPICTAYDSDGIDIYFLNARDEPRFHQITSPNQVDLIFRQVSPCGATPTGARLGAIVNPYLNDLKKGNELKPLNIIVITDGVPTDDPASVIIKAAKELDRLEASPWQVGIQFFQVGQVSNAAKALKHLDDGLVERGGGIRDMVDTVPWSGDTRQGELDGNDILKVVLGAVNRRLDRKGDETKPRRR